MMLLEEKPCYVTFETRAIEDRNVLIDEGHYGFKDVIFVRVMQPGGKEVFEDVAESWIEKQFAKVRNKQMPMELASKYKSMFEDYKKGEETPLEGTPIRGWPVLTPAQGKTIISAGIRTVEDLAAASEEALMNIGMGARSFKHKAEAWLKSSEQGKSTQRLVDLELKFEQLEKQRVEDQEYIALLENKVKMLEGDNPAKKPVSKAKKGQVSLDMDDI